MLAIGVFSGLAIGDSLWRAQPVPTWAIGATISFVAALALTCTAFRRNAVESAVRIVGFDSGLKHVFLHFKNPQYRDEFLRENQMTAELVTWVCRT